MGAYGGSMEGLPEKVGFVDYMPKTPAENIAAATQLKEEGNARFKAGDFKNAKKCYLKMLVSLRHLDSATASGGEMAGMSQMLGGKGGMGGSNPADSCSPEEKAQVEALMLAMHKNTGIMNLKLEKWEAAITSFGKVLEKDPENKKVLFMRGKCFVRTKNTDAATNDLRKCDQEDKEVPNTGSGHNAQYCDANEHMARLSV